MDIHDICYGLDRVEILSALCDFLCKQSDDTRISVLTIVEDDYGRPQITATFC